MAALLDSLPPEILLEVASWLDWRSLLSLERVSAPCRDAAKYCLGQLRVLRVTEENEPDVELGTLRVLLPQLTNLRELHVDPCRMRTAQQVLQVMEALVAASQHWPELFTHGVDEECVVAVLAALPGLRAFRVHGINNVQGAWLTQLPVELRQLSVNLTSLDWTSTALVQLARCAELDRLELLLGNDLQPEHLAAGLAGCTRLERLRLTVRDVSVSDCLPPTGLTALRHLHLTDCRLTDADLRRVLERLPGLESVRLMRCHVTTSSGLALLGRLPALSSLSLMDTDGVSDWVLDRLSAAPLEELQLGDRRMAFRRDVTPEGLLRLTQSCRTLRTLMLWDNDELVERVSCGPGVEEQHLLRRLRARMR